MGGSSQGTRVEHAIPERAEVVWTCWIVEREVHIVIWKHVNIGCWRKFYFNLSQSWVSLLERLFHRFGSLPQEGHAALASIGRLLIISSLLWRSIVIWEEGAGTLKGRPLWNVWSLTFALVRWLLLLELTWRLLFLSNFGVSFEFLLYFCYFLRFFWIGSPESNYIKDSPSDTRQYQLKFFHFQLPFNR